MDRRFRIRRLDGTGSRVRGTDRIRSQAVVGSGGTVLAPLAQSGAGILEFEGSGGTALQPIAMSGSSSELATGSGGTVFSPIQMAGAGNAGPTVKHPAAGGGTLAPGHIKFPPRVWPPPKPETKRELKRRLADQFRPPPPPPAIVGEGGTVLRPLQMSGKATNRAHIAGEGGTRLGALQMNGRIVILRTDLLRQQEEQALEQWVLADLLM